MQTPKHPPLRPRRLALAATVATSALLLTACGSSSGPAADASTAPNATSSATAAAATPRVAVTYDGGIVVLDGTTLEVEGDLPIEGFTRLNPAGDGRHALVTVPAGFQVLDLGTWTDDSGSQLAEPDLTDLVFEADTAGHVVRHGGKTVLYADGTSDTTIFTTADLLDTNGSLPDTEVIEGEDAHHGVSIVLEDGTFLTTVGNAESRSGIAVIDADGNEVATSDECPSVHGEGTAMNEVVVFGCSDGALVYDGGEITKITAPDEFGRMGNAYVSETSPIIAGDYKSDPDLEGYLLHQLTLIDTETKTMDVVDLPDGVEYTFRDVARGPADEILILASDGALHSMDPETGEITGSTPVVDAWDGPVEWQDPHPALTVVDGTAFVTDPASRKLHAVDIATGEITSSKELPGAPVEMATVTG
ncbi:zinc metallochaperone AztD [Arthrobacter agilis]|uniref:zinc metallochaperone AztD n=1 Tax=Arthrobacter agilis TaxID=37921 RepID=UPI002366B9F3|nr:zinc metallochaperone AztD [Arthrobacter agilis]WDF33285.1 zinc metallochaperone AztD [Arthrobacter agilis]